MEDLDTLDLVFNVDLRDSSLGGQEYQGERLFSIPSLFYSKVHKIGKGT